MALTEQQIVELQSLRMSTDLSLEALSEKFDCSVATVRMHTKDIIKNNLSGEPEKTEADVLDEKAEKTEKLLHNEMLDALKAENITPKEVAGGLKKMLNSEDLQDVKEAVKELNRIMGVYSVRERGAGQGSGGKKVIEKQYELDLPKRKES